MGVSESIKFHREKLDMLERSYANAAINPKYHQVHWWHNVWIQSNLGPRTGKDMVDVSDHHQIMRIISNVLATETYI